MKKISLFLLTFLIAPFLFAAHVLYPPKFRALDANGNPLVGGKVYTYAAGTTTPLASYTDQGAGTSNANPVILDANGEASIWLGASNYKIVLTNSADVTQYTVDNFKYSWETANLADSSVTSAKIANESIVSADILDGTIATADLAAGAVTKAKLSSLGQQVSTESDDSTTSTTDEDLTGLTITITTTGRPVFLGLIDPDGSASGSPANLVALDGTSGGANCEFSFKEATTTLARHNLRSTVTGTLMVPSSSMWTILTTVSAGAHTYKVMARRQAGDANDECGVSDTSLIGYEL